MTPKTSVLPSARAQQRLGHGKAIGVVLDFDLRPSSASRSRFQGLAVHADGVGVFQEAGARGQGAWRAHAEGGGLTRHGGRQFVVQEFQPVQNMLVAVLAFGGNAFAEDLPAAGVEHHAFDFGAAQDQCRCGAY